jgi:hypothetical protein
MSKKNTFFAFFVLFTNLLYAQKFELGIKGGADVQQISGVSFKKEFAYGYHLGAYSEIKLSKVVSIQPELYYSAAIMKKGNSLDTILYDIRANIKQIKFGYINIPILFNFKLSDKVKLQIGPRYGILSNTNLSVKSNAEKAFKSGDFALISGIQLQFSKVRVYARHQIGLTNMNEISNKENWKNQSIHIGIGLKMF